MALIRKVPGTRLVFRAVGVELMRELRTWPCGSCPPSTWNDSAL